MDSDRFLHRNQEHMYSNQFFFVVQYHPIKTDSDSFDDLVLFYDSQRMHKNISFRIQRRIVIHCSVLPQQQSVSL